MKKRNELKDIRQNLKWFGKFSLEKRLEIAFRDSKAIKILRNLLPINKKHAAAN